MGRKEELGYSDEMSDALQTLFRIYYVETHNWAIFKRVFRLGLFTYCYNKCDKNLYQTAKKMGVTYQLAKMIATHPTVAARKDHRCRTCGRVKKPEVAG